MKRHVLLSVLFFTTGSYAAAAVAAPPVKVEVVVDGDDEDDDFFGDDNTKAKKTTKVTTTVRENAEAAFDALEAEEAKRGSSAVKPRADNDNNNRNTQVVNVVVVGGEQQGAKAEVTPPAPPPVPATPNAPAPPAAPAVAQNTEADWSCFGWFGGKSRPKQADLLLFGSLGGYQDGMFLGLGAEAYATNTIGIRLVGHLGGFGQDRHGNGDHVGLAGSGNWSNQRVSSKNVQAGFSHLVDLSLTVHLFEKATFDPYVALGMSHYGYEIEFSDGVERGGSAYGRLGAGLNWHMGSFFAGADVGWYPYEIVRYEIHATDGAPDGDGRRRRGGDYEAESVDIADHFDPERFTATAHVGWRF